ncbi:MAG: biotin/lipoyl-binding protein [Gemmatimonadetes bacterium]|nr:biotin/lipoyl-binding protein [Gemmatimonadota bacterium]
MVKKKVNFMCTTFRDGFQSVYGARVFTRDFLPAVEAARNAGIDYFEAGGGALFQSPYFYCNEDAFERMDAIREAVGPEANLQTLSRGVNVVGLDSQPSDIIRLHAQLFKKHGMTTIRNFDALNDVENLVHSGRCITEAGLRHQVCVTVMELPPGCSGAHDAAFYTETLRKILDADIPFDSVCFKDASGTAVPSKAYDSVKAARKLLPEGTWIHYHTHDTSGIAVAAYQAALEAGADAIDLAFAPVSGGTSQPDILVMWHALRGTDYDLDIDPDGVREAAELLKECMADYFLPPEAVAVEPLLPWSPMPGGALTANTQMLRDNGIMDRYPAIIKAMSEVVEKGGYGTSVTPVSQFYFQQAFNNVMIGPWKKIAEDYGRMVLGYFGRTPVPPDPVVVNIASEQLGLPPNRRPVLELNDSDPKKGVEAARGVLKEAGIEDTDENVFIVAACGERGLAFLKGEGFIGVRKKTPADQEALQEDALSSTDGPRGYQVTVNGRSYALRIEGKTAIVNGKAYEVDLQPDMSEAATEAAERAGTTPVIAPIPGKVLKVAVSPGQTVEEGDVIVVLEAMKMEMQVTADVSGTVTHVSINPGVQVIAGQTLAYLG